MVQSKDEIPAGYEFQLDSTDTGWTSGRIQLTAGASVTLTLPKPGLNLFRVSAFDASGSPVKLLQNSIIITRTAATVDAIPASYSIAVEVLDRHLNQLKTAWMADLHYCQPRLEVSVI